MVRAQSGVVDEDVQLAEALDGRGDSVVDRAPIGQIQLDGRGLATVVFDSGQDVAERVGLPRRGDDVRSGAAQRQCQVVTDASVGAGDHRDSALQ